MITSTTTVIPRKGKLCDIKTLFDYLKTKSAEPYTIRDIYGKNSEVFNENEEYNYIDEGMYFNVKTYFIAISCRNYIILIETDKKLSEGGKVIDVHKTNLTESNSKQFRLYNETKGKSGMHFE